MPWYYLNADERSEKLEEFSASLESNLHPKQAIYWTLSLFLYIIFSEIIRRPIYNLAYTWLGLEYEVVSTLYITFFIAAFIVLLIIFYALFRRQRGELTEFLVSYFSLDHIIQNIVWFTIALSIGLALVNTVKGIYDYVEVGIFGMELYIYADLIVAGFSILILGAVFGITKLIIYFRNR